ncbi:DNA/RNA polymerases superfamily protein [Gossypium australe]|uniref:DNA/RNA polymerases superfamily protein n=1 Tax=Gossypium australe TaxID=47621 RepID=A0A5B6VWF9_9ROSI|nr:DNA/RNA polymerases superfamily protein [Gossypium australe]
MDKTLVSPATEIGSQSRSAGDDALSQAMLRILERVTRPHSRSGGRGSVTERLLSKCDELFKGVTRVAPTMAEYWLEATERIMNDINCTPKQKLKSAVSLLCDEAYQWRVLSLIVETRISLRPPSKVSTWGQAMWMLVDGIDIWPSMRLSHYARGMVASENERYVQFDDRLKDNFKREREFAILVEKMKIAEDVKHVEHQNRDRERGTNKRDSEPSSSVQRPKKKARLDGSIRVGVHIAPIGIQLCGDCGRRHPDECWRRIEACLMCRSLEHRIRKCPHRAD